MSLKNKMGKFNKRWNIDSLDSPEEGFKKFKTRIFDIFSDIDSHITEESITEFCQYYGIQEKWQHETYGDYKWSKNIINRLAEENDLKELCRLIEVIFALDITSLMGYDRRYKYSRSILLQRVVKAIEYSDVDVSIAVSDGEVILYPKGERKLDEELVNHPLSFLNKESGDHFAQALKYYQDKNYVKSAEGLRRSLEEFLRYKLVNKKGLGANIKELQKELKEGGHDPQVRNVVFQVFSYLDSYFNENSKHNDGDISDSESEYLIYQAGLLLRYVEKNIKNN